MAVSSSTTTEWDSMEASDADEYDGSEQVHSQQMEADGNESDASSYYETQDLIDGPVKRSHGRRAVREESSVMESELDSDDGGGDREEEEEEEMDDVSTQPPSTQGKTRSGKKALSQSERTVAKYLLQRQGIDEKLGEKAITKEEADRQSERVFASYKKKSDKLLKKSTVGTVAKPIAKKTAANKQQNQIVKYMTTGASDSKSGKKKKGVVATDSDIMVVDMSSALKKHFTPCKIKIDPSWTIKTEVVKIDKGGQKGVSYEVLNISRAAKDEKAKDYSFQLQMRYLGFVSKALQTILDTSPKMSPQQNKIYSFAEIKAMKPGKDGSIVLYSANSYPAYARTKFTADNLSVQIEDASYKGASGFVSYEALKICKLYNSVDKDTGVTSQKEFSINIPVRLLPMVKSVVDYVIQLRKEN